MACGQGRRAHGRSHAERGFLGCLNIRARKLKVADHEAYDEVSRLSAYCGRVPARADRTVTVDHYRTVHKPDLEAP